MTNYEEVEYIANLYIKESAFSLTGAEKAALDSWKAANPNEAARIAALLSSNRLPEILNQLETADAEIRKKLAAANVPNGSVYVPAIHRVHFLKTTWFRYAAVIILVFGIGAYLWTSTRTGPSRNVAHQHMPDGHDIAPGGQGAILTLADGTRLVLDSLSNGIVATQNGSQVLLKNGLLAYDAYGKQSGEMVYNTMTTPKGRQYQLLLPDGSRAWLNAASSIRFPTFFNNKERKVEITGEVYLEIAPHAHAPFKILPGRGAEIVVLGTSLNINAFENEDHITATLITGRVRVTDGKNSATLEPGQQASIKQNITVEKEVDIAKIMAWKNGAFDFNGTSLRDAMRQLERWYDIEVVYENNVPDSIPFSGRVSRKTSLKTLLDLLKGTSLKFRLEQDRKLIIEK